MASPVEQIGPYAFTQHDAQRTVANLPTVWAQLAHGRPGAEAVLEPLAPTLTGDPNADLHAVWASWLAAGPALRAAGLLPPPTLGRVAQLSTSAGGVPKLPVDRASVGWRGLEGDTQRSRQHHGRPWQALCLWSTEVIESFAADGHPLAAGSAGENITITGLDWSHVRPGVRLQIGEVVCDVTAFAEPCSQNAKFFLGGDFRSMHESRGPVSRVYAVVLEPGSISVGDAAILEP